MEIRCQIRFAKLQTGKIHSQIEKIKKQNSKSAGKFVARTPTSSSLNRES